MTSPAAHTLHDTQPALPTMRELLDHVSHYLPAQAPLHAFVHHNTLHAYEHLPFEQAVLAGASLWNTEPYQSEAAFAGHLETGRIRPEDLDDVLLDSVSGTGRAIVAGQMSRGQFRRQRLEHLFPIPKGPALAYVLEERHALRRFFHGVSKERQREIMRALGRVAPPSAERDETVALEHLWQSLARASTPTESTPRALIRRRDQLLATTGCDTDESVHPLLIRLAAAFLDQGVAYWTMPGRERGFLRAVRRLYMRPLAPPYRALAGWASELRRQEDEDWSSERTIEWALAELGVDRNDWGAYLERTLLSLRGWAGMMRHLEERPDHAPVLAPHASLADYAAVQLVLDVVAGRNTLWEHFGRASTYRDVETALRVCTDAKPIDGRFAQVARLELVYEAFVLAQKLPVDVAALTDERAAKRWLDEVAAMDELERRRFLHLAYERRHRVEVLDGIAAHCRLPHPSPPAPRVQAVFCIDDREESLRRHLEESFPAVATYGYAGFFGAAMSYQGLDDVRPRPLCPVAITPKHFVAERAEDGIAERQYRAKRRRFARWTQGYRVGSQTLVRGTLVTALLGAFALIPLVVRSLFPRIAEAWSSWIHHGVVTRPPSRLLLERDAPESPNAIQNGYRLDEMAAIVAGALRTIGLVDGFCPLVFVVGHGSSSLNNPHEAAHDCGATGGGRGGPNARAFAAMANLPAVRDALALGGIDIPRATWFIGAYHNTCDDTMTFYDEDLLPESSTENLRAAKKAFSKACTLDAHERCRRFETSPADLAVERALGHAMIHANDLAEPRPEYGHCTNAVCIVGRRARTRGLFLDRRAFLVSYDPTRDPKGELLRSLLLSVGPVGAGINLEYYFSFVDPAGYGCGTKLPHNITGLIGVMDGHATDLRTGLPWQMVEIHEPVRLLTIVEAKQAVLDRILAEEPGLRRLVGNGWIQLVAWDPDSDRMDLFRETAFRRYRPESFSIPMATDSAAYYRGHRGHLKPAHVHTGAHAHTESQVAK